MKTKKDRAKKKIQLKNPPVDVNEAETEGENN